MMILTIIITASQHVPHFIFLYKLEYVIHEENDFTENKLVKTGQSTIVEQHPPVGVAQKKKNPRQGTPFYSPAEDLWITSESCMRINHLHYQPQ